MHFLKEMLPYDSILTFHTWQSLNSKASFLCFQHFIVKNEFVKYIFIFIVQWRFEYFPFSISESLVLFLLIGFASDS